LKDKASLDFSLIIASSVHDMKNSLSMLLHSLDDINNTLRSEQVSDEQSPLINRLATLQYEAARVNNDLVQLLGLYKINENLLRANIDEHFLLDFLEEQAARYVPLFDSRNVQYQIACHSELTGYFDRDLVTGIINNILANSIRYCDGKIVISASEEAQWLVITIEDDGTGFPETMLSQPDSLAEGIDFASGNTHLGLYFAGYIARLHRQGDRQGKITLSNEGPGNGGRFRLWLP